MTVGMYGIAAEGMCMLVGKTLHILCFQFVIC